MSLLLALMMCLSLFPASVFADDGEVREDPIIEDTAEGIDEIAENIEPLDWPESEQPEFETDLEEAPEEIAVSLEEEALAETEGINASSLSDNILTEKYFPDPALLGALTDIFTNTYDFGGVLSETAAADFSNMIDLRNAGICDTRGLTYFKKVSDLILDGNPIVSLNVSGMRNLNQLSLSNCASLKNLVLSSGEKKGVVKELYAEKTGLSEINASGNGSIEKISCRYCAWLKRWMYPAVRFRL